MRNLTKTLTAVSLMAPVGAFPLGVGDIKLHSALNQHLYAEIPLNLSENESIADVRVKLASPEKFDEVGVPWTYFLSKIKFEPIVKPDGSVFIKLSSKEVLKEPFLDFLLRVSWPEGNVYREFTVLVDPPAIYQQQVLPVTPKSSVTSARQKVPNLTTQQNKKTTKTIQTTDVGRVYGPTSRLDTLWKIADKVRQDKEVSVEQMMMGLLEVNPDAFIRGNVNALKAGKTLQIPELEVVLKLSHRQARSEFKKQVNAWKGKVSGKPVAQPEPNTELETAVEENQQKLQLLAPTESEINQNVVVTPAETETVGTDAAATTSVEKEEQLASQKDQALEDRLTKLEQQIAMMQKLLVLKDEQLANLQRSKKVTSDSVAIPSEVVEPKQAKPVAKVVKVEAKAKTKPKPIKQPNPVVQPEPESASNLLYLLAAGVGIVLLGMFGWLWKRKKDVEEEEESLSMFASSSEISLPETDQDLSVPIVEDATTGGIDVGTVGESSFLSEFTPSDFDAFETDQNEVDPISEADVYLAYGRYQQAEELMRQAIADQPDRDACKLKLLEIFYANENMEAFEAYASELVAEGKQDQAEFWGKVVEMGAEICPGSGLFKTDSVSDAVLQTIVDEDKTEIEDAVLAQPINQSDELNPNDIDFDLTTFDIHEGEDDGESTEANNEEISVDEVSADIADDEIAGLDFDSSPLEDQTLSPELEELEASDGLSEEESLESLDFDLTTSPSVTEELEEVDYLEDEKTENSETLENFDFDSLSTVDTDQTATSDTASDFDFNLDLEDVGSNSDEEIVVNGDDLDVAVSDLTDMDEIETKIDLAKAYIDMGEEDAAKNITEEVLEKGTEKQKQEAQSILEKLQ